MKTFEIPMLSISFLGLCLLSGLDAPPAHADFTFGEPVNLRSVVPSIDPLHESPLCFSYDGLEMYIESDRADGIGSFDLWVLRRASIGEEWGSPENLGDDVNTAKDESNPSISADGLTLYFATNRDYKWPDIWMTTRPMKNAPWGKAVSLGPKVNDPDVGDCGPRISADGLELYFSSYRRGGYGRSDIYVIRRETTNDPWGDPENLGPVVNSTTEDGVSCLSPDGLLLLFSDNFMFGDPPRPGGYGGDDMWMTRRASLSDPWQTPVNLGPQVNSSINERAPIISPDGTMLYFISAINDDFATWENWQASIIPICDFNGDGVVDIVDVGIMIEHWHTNYSLCDIGPMPLGDGFVDAQDLKVLAEHLFEEENSLAEPIQ